MRAAGKPTGVICTAPLIVALVLGAERVKVTVGDEAETASALESWGAQYATYRIDEVAVGERHRIVTTWA
jgi:enhancing lycopene biosynthesis protein 2